MSKWLEDTKSALQIAYGFFVLVAGLIVLTIVIRHFWEIDSEAEKILNTEQVSKLQGFGFEVDLTADTVNEALPPQEVATDKSRLVLPIIRSLASNEISRLMYVGQYADQNPPDLCQYKSPTPEMRDYWAVDNELTKRHLTKMQKSQDIFNRVKEQQAKAGKNWKIGDPIWCYEMTLTGDGDNVKTVLVHYIGKVLDKARKALPEGLDPVEKAHNEPN
jgi:hypothetical protein